MVVVLAVGLLLGFSEYAFGIGLGVGGFVFAEASRGMRQDRRISPQPTAAQRIRAGAIQTSCLVGSAALLFVEGQNVVAQGAAGLLAAFGAIGLVMSAVASRLVARRRPK